MGTPEFAVASLDALVKAGCTIVGVVTAPDKSAGRGMLLQQSAVKQYAVENNLFILQPEKLKAPAFIDTLRSLQADIQVVVAFRMLPEVVWNMPPMGTINLHGSLLPQYRGAAPINWAVINGEHQTGVTTFRLKHDIDTGDILMQRSFPIAEDENAGHVHDRMKEIGAALLLETIKGISNKTISETSQSSGFGFQLSTLKHAPKIFTDTCIINWNKTIDEVYNLVRGLAPFPAAFTFLEKKKLKVYKTEKINKPPLIEAGNFETDKKTYLQFACKDGYIKILELQLEGKKKMQVEDFLRGYRFTA